MTGKSKLPRKPAAAATDPRTISIDAAEYQSFRRPKPRLSQVQIELIDLFTDLVQLPEMPSAVVLIKVQLHWLAICKTNMEQDHDPDRLSKLVDQWSDQLGVERRYGT